MLLELKTNMQTPNHACIKSRYSKRNNKREIDEENFTSYCNRVNSGSSHKKEDWRTLTIQKL